MNTEKYIDFIITQKCTYRCPYCSQSKCENKEQNNATDETILAFYKFLDNLDKDYQITLTGGEALLHPNFFDIITTVKNKGFKINLISNLSFKMDSYQKIFDTLNSSLNRFDISIHINQIQNFELTIEKLEKFINNKPKETQMTIFIPLYNITNKQEAKIDKIIKLAKKYHVEYEFQKIRFLNSYKNKTKKEDKYKSDHKLYLTYGNLCYAGNLSAVVYEDGEVYRCYSSRFMQSNHLGNIKDNNLHLNSNCEACPMLSCSCPKPNKYGQITKEENYKEAIKSSCKNIIYLPYYVIKNRTIIIAKIKQFFSLN